MPLAGESETPGGATPTPLSWTVWVRNWSASVSVPVWMPMLFGVNRTDNTQLERALREFPQALTTEKLPLLIWAEMRVRDTSPALVRVICCGVLVVLSCWTEKLRAAGERLSVAGEVPMPFRLATWVPASSTSVRVPVREPLAVGVKTIETVQLTWGTSVAAQVLAESLKSPLIAGI